MRISHLLLSCLAPVLLAASSQRAWKAGFDYTNLAPSDDEQWLPLSQAKVTMEEAIALARGADEKAHVYQARLVPGAEPHWEIDLWTIDEAQGPQRALVQVSTSEPKELSRTAAAVDTAEWAALSQTEVPLTEAAETAKTRLEKLENLRTSQGRFVSTQPAHWELELFGIDEDASMPRRWVFEMSPVEPRVQRRLLQDRFPGEPLRRDRPRALPSGLLIHDFREGDGVLVSRTSKVKVHYRLFLLDNTKIHDTWKDHSPETFLLTEAPLKGMIEGVEGMRAGGKRKICIPHTLAFGEAGSQLAPPKAMVVCDLEVLSVE